VSKRPPPRPRSVGSPSVRGLSQRDPTVPGRARRGQRAATARTVAYEALQRIDHDGAYANLLVPQLLDRSGLDGRDRGFVTELVYGATRMRRACDFAVDRFLVRDPPPELRTLLRLGAYQLVFAGVAPHAAVSATVDLAPARLRGVTNAVLRKVAAHPPVWPDDATRLSYPDWIVDRLVLELGRDDALAALAQMNEPAPVTTRDDTYVQDPASTAVADAVGAVAGDVVVDVCAAPGGKATRIATTGALVVAADIRPHRAALVVANAARLRHPNVAVIVADGTAPPLRAGSVDRVLVDAPCSGLGALRRRPDARWRIDAADISVLAELQRRLLAGTMELLRPGGLLVYSVCTLTAAESIDHDAGPLATWASRPPPGQPWAPYGRGARLLPHAAGSDGMVVLLLERPV
jgi:16S rRNA (cytosine967-C5)-methyltransferase